MDECDSKDELDMSSKLKKKKIIKSKVFRPTLVPRYLPGSVGDIQLKTDLKMYNTHRYNVFYATKVIDNNPPRIKCETYFKTSSLTDDLRRNKEINKHNREILKNINTAFRVGGHVDCYNARAYERYSKWDAHEFEMKRIVKFNKRIYRKLKKQESFYPREKYLQEWPKILNKMQHMARFILLEYKKESLAEKLKALPSISKGLDNPSPNRPRVFMDIHNSLTGLYVGRLVIELYHEYVPVTCQNFMSLCKGENGLTYKGCSIFKIIRNDYFASGDIIKQTGKGGKSIYGDKFAEENFLLRHTRPGVACMIRVGNKENNSQFMITLRRRCDLNGKSVVFGKVVKGMPSTTDRVQNFARDVGKPFLYISDCGEYTPEFAKLSHPKDIEIKRKTSF